MLNDCMLVSAPPDVSSLVDKITQKCLWTQISPGLVSLKFGYLVWLD